MLHLLVFALLEPGFVRDFLLIHLVVIYYTHKMTLVGGVVSRSKFT